MSQSGTIYSQGRLCSDCAGLSDDTRVAMAWVPLGETDILNSSAFYGSAPLGNHYWWRYGANYYDPSKPHEQATPLWDQLK